VKTDRAGFQGHALRRRTLESLRSMPGVVSASFEMSPMSYKGWEIAANVEGYPYGPNEDDLVHVNYIAEDYFQTLRTPLLDPSRLTCRVAGPPARVRSKRSGASDRRRLPLMLSRAR